MHRPPACTQQPNQAPPTHPSPNPHPPSHSCQLLSDPVSQRRLAAVAHALLVLAVLPLPGGSYLAGGGPNPDPGHTCAAVLALHGAACVLASTLAALLLQRRTRQGVAHNEPAAAAPAGQRDGWLGWAWRLGAAAAVRLAAVLGETIEALDPPRAVMSSWMLLSLLWSAALVLTA